jgi:hypothetical protein
MSAKKMNEREYSVYIHSFDLKRGMVALVDPVKGTLEQCKAAADLWCAQDNFWIYGAVVGKGKALLAETAVVSPRKVRVGGVFTPAYTCELVARFLEKHRAIKTKDSAVSQYDADGNVLDDAWAEDK